MKDYEILSRATAFLLQVDPPEPTEDNKKTSSSSESAAAKPSSHNSKGHVNKSAFPHLQENINVRNKLLQKQEYKYDPASGPKRLPHQLNWLEFCPTAFRPKVHVVASSHVISPFLWPKYYNQDWLKVVTQEHVRYSLEVWGKSSDSNSSSSSNVDHEDVIIAHDGKLKGPSSYAPLAKFALNPFPIHHPKELDIAVIHLKDEDAALDHMMKLGIQPLHLPTMYELENYSKPVFEPGEKVLFQGFEVYETNATDQETLTADQQTEKSTGEEKDDERVFHPYSSLGICKLASPDRFLAATDAGPLPEGLCGGPVIQCTKMNNILTIRGVVEGIVPPSHENKELAGLASFLPSYRIREFVDWAEKTMLEQIIDEDLFIKVVDLKERKDQRGTTYHVDGTDVVNDQDDVDPNVKAGMESTFDDDSETPQLDGQYQEIIASLKKHHTQEEVDAILGTVEREREEVVKIMQSEGGDLDDVIERVRRKTYEEKDRLMKEIEAEMMKEKGSIEEGEIISDDDKKS